MEFLKGNKFAQAVFVVVLLLLAYPVASDIMSVAFPAVTEDINAVVSSAVRDAVADEMESYTEEFSQNIEELHQIIVPCQAFAVSEMVRMTDKTYSLIQDNPSKLLWPQDVESVINYWPNIPESSKIGTLVSKHEYIVSAYADWLAGDLVF